MHIRCHFFAKYFIECNLPNRRVNIWYTNEAECEKILSKQLVMSVQLEGWQKGWQDVSVFSLWQLSDKSVAGRCCMQHYCCMRACCTMKLSINFNKMVCCMGQWALESQAADPVAGYPAP